MPLRPPSANQMIQMRKTVQVPMPATAVIKTAVTSTASRIDVQKAHPVFVEGLIATDRPSLAAEDERYPRGLVTK